jgi:hypothetical protein
MRVLVIFEHFFLEGSVYHKVVFIHQTALALIDDDIEQLEVCTWLKYPILCQPVVFNVLAYLFAILKLKHPLFIF